MLIKNFKVTSFIFFAIVAIFVAMVSASTVIALDSTSNNIINHNTFLDTGMMSYAVNDGEALRNFKDPRLDAQCKSGLRSNCKFMEIIRNIARALSATVGVAVVIGIVVGGIQYSAARDNPQASAAAKKRITNSILALVIYLFSFAFLQWLIPGGIVW